MYSSDLARESRIDSATADLATLPLDITEVASAKKSSPHRETDNLGLVPEHSESDADITQMSATI